MKEKKKRSEDRNFHVGQLKLEGARDTKVSEKSIHKELFSASGCSFQNLSDVCQPRQKYTEFI